MNNGIVAALCTTIGAAVGAYISKFYWKKKYEQQANEEISSMREKYLKMESEKKPDEDSEYIELTPEEVGEDISEVRRDEDIYEETARTLYTSETRKKVEGEVSYILDIIDEDDFASLPGYEGYHFLVTDTDTFTMKCVEDGTYANIYQYLDEAQMAYFLENEKITLRNEELQEDYVIELEVSRG